MTGLNVKMGRIHLEPAHQIGCDGTKDNQFLANQSFTSSLCTTSSLKVYAPDFSLRTILMTFVCWRPPPVCSDATVFFAMVAVIQRVSLNYLISLCTVYLRSTGLNFLISMRSGVFFRFFVVT